MKKVLFVTVCLASGLLLLRAFAQSPQKPGEAPKHQLATIGQPIAGIPFDQAEKIANQHTAEIRALPGVVSVTFTADGLVVETVKPEILPANVEGLPVIPIPPIDAEGVGVLERGLPPRASVPPPPELPPVADEPPHPVACPPGATLEPGAHRCKYTKPNQAPTSTLVPPPPGVIVLKPGKVRENRDSCPENFEEINAYGWRFCVDPQNPQEIPPLYGPPIAGIAYEEALAINNRHVDELMKIPGVVAAGLGIDGIHVETSKPELIPKQIEGLPVIVKPPVRRGPVGHTFNNIVRPLHGAAALYSYTVNNGGTLTGVVVSDGHPWLIFPAHIISTCSTPSPCALNGTPLNSCPHYNTANQRVMVQPINSSTSVVGYAQRWSTLPNGGVSNDVAAAYFDSDTIEGNNFLTVNRKVERETGPIDFSGIALAPPPVGTQVVMRSSIGPPHEETLTVTGVGQNALITDLCGSSSTVTFQNQTFYTTSQFAFQPGDSGTPVFNTTGATNGDLIGMINWCQLVFDPVTGQFICSGNRGGTNAPTIESTLKFDRWYGKNTVKDQTVGVFRPSTGQWIIDNGDRRLNSCSASGGDTTDQCFTYGQSGDRPVTGDWDLDSNRTVTVGVFRTTTNPQQFLLRNSNSAGAPNYTISAGPPSFGYKPVSGKWNGVNNGTTKIGVYNPGTAPGTQRGFYLENGDKIINGCPGADHCFFTGNISLAEDIPVAGDWNGDGIHSIGVFRPSTSTFYLSHLDPATIPDNSQLSAWNLTVPAGPPSFGYQPVIGDWTGETSALTTKSKLGVYNPSNGGWYLDNGNLSFPGCAEDQCTSSGFGLSGDIPVALDKTIVRAN